MTVNQAITDGELKRCEGRIVTEDTMMNMIERFCSDLLFSLLFSFGANWSVCDDAYDNGGEEMECGDGNEVAPGIRRDGSTW